MANRRPPLAPNMTLLILGLPVLALLIVRSGLWWLLALTSVLVSLRLMLWVLAPYSRFAYRAIEPRQPPTAEKASEVVEPYRHIPVIGWFTKLGSWVLGWPRRTGR